MVLKMTQSFTRSMHTVGVSVGPAKRSASESKLKAAASDASVAKRPAANQSQRAERGESTASSSSSSYLSSSASSSALDEVVIGGDGNLQEMNLDDDEQQPQTPSPQAQSAPPPPVPKASRASVVEGLSHGLIEISLAAQDEDDDVGPSPSDLEAIDDLIECAKDGDLPQFQRLCEALARRHITPDCAGYMGWTPAHWAARHGHVHLLEFLLHARVNLDVLDKKGDSLLHKAAANSQFRSCQWLLQHGFNVQARNNNGQTPLDLAQQQVALTKSDEAALCESVLARENANTF